MNNNQPTKKDNTANKMKDLFEDIKSSAKKEKDTLTHKKNNQSLKDQSHTTDENNILVDTKNNRMP